MCAQMSRKVTARYRSCGRRREAGTRQLLVKSRCDQNGGAATEVPPPLFQLRWCVRNSGWSNLCTLELLELTSGE